MDEKENSFEFYFRSHRYAFVLFQGQYLVFEVIGLLEESYKVDVFWSDDISIFKRGQAYRTLQAEGDSVEIVFKEFENEKFSTTVQVTAHPWGIPSEEFEPFIYVERYSPPVLSIRVWDNGLIKYRRAHIDKITLLQTAP